MSMSSLTLANTSSCAASDLSRFAASEPSSRLTLASNFASTSWRVTEFSGLPRRCKTSRRKIRPSVVRRPGRRDDTPAFGFRAPEVLRQVLLPLLPPQSAAVRRLEEILADEDEAELARSEDEWLERFHNAVREDALNRRLVALCCVLALPKLIIALFHFQSAF